MTAGQDPFAMQLLDKSAEVVAAWTGIRAQYIAAGWSPAGAEQMVLEIIRGANKNT